MNIFFVIKVFSKIIIRFKNCCIIYIYITSFRLTNKKTPAKKTEYAKIKTKKILILKNVYGYNLFMKMLNQDNFRFLGKQEFNLYKN